MGRMLPKKQSAIGKKKWHTESFKQKKQMKNVARDKNTQHQHDEWIKYIK